MYRTQLKKKHSFFPRLTSHPKSEASYTYRHSYPVLTLELNLRNHNYNSLKFYPNFFWIVFDAYRIIKAWIKPTHPCFTKFCFKPALSGKQHWPKFDIISQFEQNYLCLIHESRMLKTDIVICLNRKAKCFNIQNHIFVLVFQKQI